MEQTYSVSSVVGFNDHVEPTVVVKLPLKYQNEGDGDKSPNSQFNEKLAGNASVIALQGSIIDNVSWELLNDMKTIILTPINTRNNNFDLKYQKLKIELPNKIIGNKCISIYYCTSSSIDENDQGHLIIDLLDENYLLITLKIDINQFIIDGSSRFTLDKFYKWGNISVPYSFELRSVPFLLKSIDSLNVIVSLKDGGLLHFKRAHVLQDFDVYNFNDTTSLLPLNFLGGFFKRNNTSNIVVEGINSNSIVDVLLVSSQEIITLSVSKQLKVWNLNSHQSSTTPISLGENTDNSWLSTIPSKHLQLIDDVNNDKKFLTGYFTSASKDDKSAFQINAWEIMSTKNNFELKPVGTNEHFDIPSQENCHDQTQNFNWFIQDFCTEMFDDFILYHILWKSYTSSILATYQYSIGNGVELLYSSFKGPSNNDEEFSPYHEVDYYIHKVLNSGRYNNLILQTSLNILKKHYSINTYTTPNKPIRTSIQETIHQISVDPKQVWFKLDLLCEEYRKMSEEVLGLTSINQGNYLVIQANGLQTYRPSHYFEKLFFPESIESPEYKLASILTKITSSVSRRTCHKLSEKVRQHGKLSINDTDELYETYLKSRFPDSDVQEIITELSTIPNYTDILNSFVNSVVSKNSIIDQHISQPDQLSPLKKLSTIATIKDIIEQHEYILSTLLVMFLLFGGTDDNVNYINNIIDKLNNYETFILVLDTCFNSMSPYAPIEGKNINNLEYSLFWSAIVKRHPELNVLIQAGKLNDAFSYIFNHNINSYQNLIVDVTIDLINRGEGKFIRDYFFPKLSDSKTIDRFLMGLVYLINDEPEKFFEIFKDYQTFQIYNDENIENKLKTSLSVDSSIKEFLDAIFTKEENPIQQESNYYHALSALAKSRIGYYKRPSSAQMSLTIGKTNPSQIETEFLNTALDFEHKSIELLKQIQPPSASTINKIDLYYLQVFELSLKLSNYDSVYDALSNISSDKISEEYDYEQLFTKFIRSIISNQSISIIFPPNRNELYKNNFLLIDKIIVNLANTDYDLAGSRRIYEYLYSWRLFGASDQLSSDQLADKRGAIEALYMFVTRFRFESNLLEYGSTTTIEDSKQFKLKILELYMIIMNCLKSFEDDDDKWLLKQDKESNTLVKLDDIKIEYFEWIKELERELHEF